MAFSIESLLKQSAPDKSLGDIALMNECLDSLQSESAVKEKMAESLAVMRESAEKGLEPSLKSMSGMTGGQAAKYAALSQGGNSASGDVTSYAGFVAMAVAEYNACMGKIVAAPTAGACGVLPGVLFALEKYAGATRDELIMALFAAAAIGEVIANRASISGAQSGCQAEIGAAAAMAAAAAAQLRGGSAKQACQAASFALMNLMGLVCDPVRGLVEIPCVYRNVAGASIALTAADMALCGIDFPIPPDEVIDAMGRVGAMLPAALRETGEGGCASCPSAR
ncbi:MAG: L-serine ammonia-lyase, iron-sulfur-dependent, subunit alpha [Clostridia bacterium]|nr:L-serine ammonia-lyase, iron-sulfur-dependent, subunit alpha [Clostridia bacterium]